MPHPASEDPDIQPYLAGDIASPVASLHIHNKERGDLGLCLVGYAFLHLGNSANFLLPLIADTRIIILRSAM